MPVISPKDRVLYMLRLLLLTVKGAISFENLRTVNGILCDNFEEAAAKLNLIGDDKEHEKALKEASDQHTAFQTRLLFVYICIVIRLHRANYGTNSLNQCQKTIHINFLT